MKSLPYGSYNLCTLTTLGSQKYLCNKLTLTIFRGFEFDQETGYNITQMFLDKTQVTRDENRTSKALASSPVLVILQILLTLVNSSP